MPDPSLHDEQLENEIKLVGELVLAASQHESALSQDEIDEVLGLDGEVGADGGARGDGETAAVAVTDPAGAGEH